MGQMYQVIRSTTNWQVGDVIDISNLSKEVADHLLRFEVIAPCFGLVDESAADPSIDCSVGWAEGRIRSTLRGIDGLKVEVIANDGREWVIQVASAHGWELLDVVPAEVKAEGSEADKAPSPDAVKESVTPDPEKASTPAVVDLTIPIKGGGKITRVQVAEGKFRYKVWHGDLEGADLHNLKAEQVAPIAEALGVAAEKKAIIEKVDAEAPGE